jgi:hypothetical protein
MSSINASTSGVGGVITEGDGTSNLQIQGAGITGATATSSGFQINTYVPSNSLINYGSSVTLSGTSTTLTSSLPSWVKRVTLVINGVTQSSTDFLIVRLNGVTTGYNSVAAITNTGFASSSSTTGFIFYGTGSTYLVYGAMTLTNQTGNVWVQSHALGFPTPPSGVYGGGTITLGSVLTSILITTPTGTPTLSGAITVFYE